MLGTKLPQVGTTIFTTMSQLANECGAINLSQGFPDFESPKPLLEALGRYSLAGQNQYAPMIGLECLRHEIASQIAARDGRKLNPDTEITITPGASQAIFCAIQALVRLGDEVIVFDPCYDSYEPSVVLAGGTCVHLPLTLPDFRIDWQKLSDAITDKTRLVIINSPHNPSGRLITREDLDQLAALLRGREVYLLSDEVYEHLVFDGAKHASVLAHDELYEKAFVVSSFGKTFHVTGWKTGYIVAPPALTQEMRKIHQYVSFAAVTPIQHAVAEFMATYPEHITELADFYQAKRDLFTSVLANSRFTWTQAAGTYFQLLDYSGIRDDLNDVEMSLWLTKTYGVASIPISVFYQTPPSDLRLLRFCFAKREETLLVAGERLCAI